MRWAGGAALFVAVTAAQLVRQSGAPSYRTVWAEDGLIWYWRTPDLGHLFEGYAGYLQLPSRAFGLAAHVLPIRYLAVYWALAGAVMTTVMAAAVWYLSAQWIGSKVLRAVLALNVPFISSLLLEQTANGVNLIWAYVFVAWWAILFHPQRTRDVVIVCVLVVLGVTSSALALAYAPAVLYLLWLRRDRPTRIVTVVYFAAALLQAGVSLDTAAESSTKSTLADLPGIFLVRGLGSGLVGERWLPDAWDALGWGLAVIAGLVAVVLTAVLAWRSRGTHRTFGLITVAYSVLLFVAPVYWRGTDMFELDPGRTFHAIGTRFTSLSVWLFTSGLAILFSGCAVRAHTRRWIVGGIAVWFAVLAIAGFRGTNPRSRGPEWLPSVGAAREACAHDPHQIVVLDVVPYPFDVTASCRDLGFG